jgi:xylan 1,4-beta-xylosidase
MIPISSSGGENSMKSFSKAVKNITGHHDVFIKFPTGKEGMILIKSVRFLN